MKLFFKNLFFLSLLLCNFLYAVTEELNIASNQNPSSMRNIIIENSSSEKKPPKSPAGLPVFQPCLKYKICQLIQKIDKALKTSNFRLNRENSMYLKLMRKQALQELNDEQLEEYHHELQKILSIFDVKKIHKNQPFYRKQASLLIRLRTESK